MKKITLLIYLISFLHFKSKAVTATVGGIGADYASLWLACNAINNGILTGNIELQIQGNTNEPNSATINESGVGSTSYIQVKIYPTVTCTISSNFGSINLNGADNVTIDGRINQTGNNQDLTLINYAGGIIFFANSATNNLIQYLKLLGGGTVIGFGAAGNGNGNDNNTVHHCDMTINQNGVGWLTSCISDDNLSTALEINDNVHISYNKMHDYSDYGIRLYNNNKSWEINNNSFYFTNDNSSGDYTFIKAEDCSNFLIHDNFFGGHDESASGTLSVMHLQAIYLETTDPYSVFNIYNNTFKGLDVDGNGGTARLIFLNGKANIYNNIFGGSNLDENINYATYSNSTLIYNISSQKIYAYNNTFEGIHVGGILSYNITNLFNNTFNNIRVKELITYADTVSQNFFSNIKELNTLIIADVVTQNQINSCKFCNGCVLSTPDNTLIVANSVSNNTILNLRCDATTSIPSKVIDAQNVNNNYIETFHRGFIGIVSPAIGSLYAYNNILKISCDSLPAATNIYGIQLNSGTNPIIRNNTIIISGNITGTQKNSCIYVGINYSNIDIRNNILINSSAGTAKTYGMFLSSLQPNYAFNYNNFYPTGSNAYAGGVNVFGDFASLTDWQTNTGLESNSLSIDPLFLNILPQNIYSYGPQAAMPGILIAGINTDILGNIRSNPPTMGAIETGTVFVGIDSGPQNKNNLNNKEFIQVSDLYLYPNPSNGLYSFIDHSNLKNVEVYTSLGEKIISQTNQKQINLCSYPNGIYFVRINGQKVLKLLKE